MYKHYVFLFLLFIYNWHLPNKEETLKSRRISILLLSFSIIFHFFLVKFLFFLLCNYRVWFDLYSLTHAILCIRCIHQLPQKKVPLLCWLPEFNSLLRFTGYLIEDLFSIYALRRFKRGGVIMATVDQCFSSITKESNRRDNCSYPFLFMFFHAS